MPSSRRPIRPEDYYRFRFIGDPQLSPDGAWVACVISRPDRKSDRLLSDIWLIATRGRKRVQLTNRFHRDSSPRWSPDGIRLAFLAPDKDDSKAKPQLWVIPVDGGEAQQVTHLKQGVSSPVWSPNGRAVAFLARDPKPEDDPRGPDRPKIEMRAGRVYATDVTVADRIRYRSADLPPKGERRHIHVISATGGRPRKLTDGDHDDCEPAWSPDGKQIAFSSSRARDPDWDLVSDVWVVSARGGSPRLIAKPAGGAHSPCWSPDGKLLAYVGSPTEEVSRMDSRIWSVPAAGGQAKSLTDALDRVPHSPRWSRDGSAVYFQCTDEGFDSLWSTTLDGAVARVLPEERCVLSYSTAACSDLIAYLHTAPEHPADLFLFDSEGKRERRLTNENAAALRPLKAGATEAFRCRSFDGTPIHGWVVKPPGFRAGRKYPLVLMTHGGPYSAFLHQWRLDAQVLAGQGYIVVYANPRGSVGYGLGFQTSAIGNWGAEDSRDYLAAFKHVARQGYVDRSRVGVMGASYGGYMTVWLLGTSNTFAAGVASCAATDEPMFYYCADLPLWSEQELGGPPWERPEDYRRVSASSHAHKIRSPLLLLHAEDDSRVPINNSEIVFTTLKRLGVETVFVRYPSGGHPFPWSAPRYLCDTMNRTLDWFDRHLKRRGRD